MQPRERDGLQAGDRAPDAPLRGQGGQPTRLFSLFRGPHWTLIGHETDRAAIKPRPGLHIHIVGERGDLIDDGGHFRDAYGLAPGEWALIRPDGYVGAIVGADDMRELELYLARAGVAPREVAAPSPRRTPAPASMAGA